MRVVHFPIFVTDVMMATTMLMGNAGQCPAMWLIVSLVHQRIIVLFVKLVIMLLEADVILIAMFPIATLVLAPITVILVRVATTSAMVVA